MTLEEAIAHAEQQAIRYEKEAKRKHEYGGAFYDAEVQACLICAEQHRQLAEWLKELIERRKQPEIIYCKDCKYYGRKDKRRFYRGCDCLEGRIATIVPDRDFCSRAKGGSDDRR